VAESTIVLKHEEWMRIQCSIGGIPVDGVSQINVEIRDDGLSLASQIRWRWNVGALDVLQLADQGLLRRASGTGVPFDGTLIDHDCESEPWMVFGLGHDQFCGRINRIVGAVPVDDDTIDTAADHVSNLAFHLCRVGGTVADIHVVRSAKPQKHVRVNFDGTPSRQQGMDIDFAYIRGA
jgi:hypothetical protein